MIILKSILFQIVFFSRLAKYLLFFSSYSTIFGFDRVINPFNLVSVKFSSMLLFLSILSFNKLILLASDESTSSFCNCVISFVKVFSCLIVSFFLYVAYFIFSFLTVSFISYHFVFGFASLFISAISEMLFLIISW